MNTYSVDVSREHASSLQNKMMVEELCEDDLSDEWTGVGIPPITREYNALEGRKIIVREGCTISVIGYLVGCEVRDRAEGTLSVAYEACNQAAKIAAAGAVGGAVALLEVDGTVHRFEITIQDLQEAKLSAGSAQTPSFRHKNYCKWPCQIMYDLPSTDPVTGKVMRYCLYVWEDGTKGTVFFLHLVATSMLSCLATSMQLPCLHVLPYRT
jgi:hypothetical protein